MTRRDTRKKLEAAIQALIDLLDELDGDPDLEDAEFCDDGHDELPDQEERAA